MLDALFELISSTLNFFYELVPNYAVAIGLLTLAVMVITTPLTLKGTRSMIEMQRLQPEMRKLQVQYKDDRQKLNEEMMRFYKEHQINPLGGCFPLLVQAPVFSILFYVVRGLTNSYKFTGLQRSLGDLQLGFEPAVRQGFRPKYLGHDTELYQALLGSDHMNAFGIDLARSASTALSVGFTTALPYLGLVAVIAVLSWFQQKQIMGRNPNAEMTSQQRMMMRIGPAMYILFAFVSPAAIGVYFLVSTVWRVGQQGYITRSLYHGEDAIGVQAQQAMAEARRERAKEGGGGGFLDALSGGSRNRDDGKGGGRSTAKPSPNGSSRKSGGADGARGKTGAATSRSGAKSGGASAGAGGGAASKPHPRSRKKKKRK